MLLTARRYQLLAVCALPFPFLGNFFGWIFTEMGRQPWVVFGLLKTANAVSPSVPAWSIGISLAAYVLVYGVLAAITVYLMMRVVNQARTPEVAGDSSHEQELSLATAY